MSITVTIDIPALDRLCGWLESRERAGIVQQIEDEIVGKLKEAAQGGVPKPEFKEVPTPDDLPWKDEAKAEPTAPAPEAAPPVEARGAVVTLDQVQRAAAQLRDQGKLGQVTGMFGEFGIKKLSDLTGDALQGFAERLRALGAKL